MTPSEEGPLFEAMTVPHQSGTPAGLRVIVALVLTVSGGLTVLFWSLGAWPVVGFMGGEVALVIGMLRVHQRWSSRIAERITLADGRLRVDRTDRHGRRRAVEFDAYWARVALTPRPGRISELRLAARGRSTEIGHFLHEPEKTSLAEALGQALRRYREPVFDNPQTRGGLGR